MAEASDSDWSADYNVATELRGPTEDGSDDSDNGQAAGAPLPGFVTTPPQCFGSDGRPLANPYNARADVGRVHVLCGNWGGSRSATKSVGKKLSLHINTDLKKSPALIMCLQELDEAQQEFLSSSGDAGNPAIAAALRSKAEVEGGSAELAAAILENRPSFRWKIWGGAETGKTLVIAVRNGVCSAFNPLLWRRREDGVLKDNSKAGQELRKQRREQAEAAAAASAANAGLSKAQRKIASKLASDAVAASQAAAAALRPTPTQAGGEQHYAYSRFQVAHLRFTKTRAGIDGLTVLNTHMHHNTAKKA